MAIVWPCPIPVDQYVLCGHEVEVPRPDCPDCLVPMTFSSGYQRWVRDAGVCHRLWIARGRCSGCRRSHALIPSFCLLGRLDVVTTVGDALVSVVMGDTGVRPVAIRLQVPFTTVRDWVRRFAHRAATLAAGFAALAVRFSGKAADLTAPTPAEQALIALNHAYGRVVTRSDAGLIPDAFGFASLVTGGAMIATAANPPWLILGTKRFIPPVPQFQDQQPRPRRYGLAVMEEDGSPV